MICIFEDTFITWFTFRETFLYVRSIIHVNRIGKSQCFSTLMVSTNFLILWVILHLLSKLGQPGVFTQSEYSYACYSIWACWWIKNEAGKPITCILEWNTQRMLNMRTACYLSSNCSVREECGMGGPSVYLLLLLINE